MTASAPSAREPLGTATVVALAAMSLAVFAISSDFISLAVALPKIERQFHTEVETVQWVMNAYAIVFGVLIVTGGRLSDMFGHRRAFFAGMAIFAVFSIPAAAAGSSGLLIGARAAMGIGGALVWPSTVALIFGLMPGSRVGLAGAIVLGVSGDRERTRADDRRVPDR